VNEFGNDEVEVDWRPFIIDPNTNPAGEDYLTYNKRRWGSDGWTRPLRQMGATVGAPFKKWKWWPATMAAHCLVELARAEGISTSLSKSALFEALYEEGENISDVQVLAEIAAKHLGLDREKVLHQLESRTREADINREIQTGRDLYGVTSVPHFIISGDATPQQYSLSGAHPTEQFLELFRKVKFGDA